MKFGSRQLIHNAYFTNRYRLSQVRFKQLILLSVLVIEDVAKTMLVLLFIGKNFDGLHYMWMLNCQVSK